MKGTLINTVAIILGTGIGLLLGDRYPEKVKETVMSGLGLVTRIIGIKMALETANILYPLAGVALGGIVGELIDIDSWVNKLGSYLERKFAGKGSKAESAPDGSLPSQGKFAKGFVTASLLFCVGPMAIIGGIQDGLTGDYSTLAAKSAIDAFTSMFCVVFRSRRGVFVYPCVFIPGCDHFGCWSIKPDNEPGDGCRDDGSRWFAAVCHSGWAFLN